MPSNQSTRDYVFRTQELMRAAAAAFVRVFVAKVPRYTGASWGQLVRLAQAAGVPIDAQGNGLSDLTKTSFTLVFNVDHFLINEAVDATQWGLHLRHPGPYNAIPAALAAAEEVMADAAERLATQMINDTLGDLL